MEMPPWSDAALPRGSLILVTGASGFLASHIISEAIRTGFRVRGVVRSESKARQTAALFNSPESYSPVIVADIADEGAFDDNNIFKDVDGIIHCASVMTFSPDPESVILPTVAGTLRMLQAAKGHVNVKRFVYTSSATAITFPSTNDEGSSSGIIITAADWNHQAVPLAHDTPGDDPAKAFLVYSASKVEAERAVWRFVHEEKPLFTVNCVHPATSFGRILGSPGESGTWIPNLVREKAVPVHIPPQYIVDVSDSARIHLAALLDTAVSDKRILAFGHSINWNDIIEIIQRYRPELSLPARVPNLGHDVRSVDNAFGAGLLRKWWDQDGFRSLDETVRDNLVGL